MKKITLTEKQLEELTSLRIEMEFIENRINSLGKLAMELVDKAKKEKTYAERLMMTDLLIGSLKSYQFFLGMYIKDVQEKMGIESEFTISTTVTEKDGDSIKKYNI